MQYHPNMTIAELLEYLRTMALRYPAKHPTELFDEVSIRNAPTIYPRPPNWRAVRHWIPMQHITPGEGEVVETKDAHGVVRTMRMQRNRWTSPDEKTTYLSVDPVYWRELKP